jgi:hypothetical protein
MVSHVSRLTKDDPAITLQCTELSNLFIMHILKSLYTWSYIVTIYQLNLKDSNSLFRLVDLDDHREW